VQLLSALFINIANERGELVSQNRALPAEHSINISVRVKLFFLGSSAVGGFRTVQLLELTKRPTIDAWTGLMVPGCSFRIEFG